MNSPADISNVDIYYINEYIKVEKFYYLNKPKQSKSIRNIRNINLRINEFQDCISCGGGGCGRCCSKNPDQIVDCISCGGGGCSRCC